MDTDGIKARLMEFFKKYRMVLVVLLAGILLMALPEQKAQIPAASDTQEEKTSSTEEKLSHILSRIQGAGKVEVMLTERQGSESIYQTDFQNSADSTREDTVILSGSDREEAGLVRQINPPIYLGAVIVCQGGDSPTVKLNIVEAVMSVTGLSSDRITVLKMK